MRMSLNTMITSSRMTKAQHHNTTKNPSSSLRWEWAWTQWSLLVGGWPKPSTTTQPTTLLHCCNGQQHDDDEDEGCLKDACCWEWQTPSGMCPLRQRVQTGSVVIFVWLQCQPVLLAVDRTSFKVDIWLVKFHMAMEFPHIQCLHIGPQLGTWSSWWPSC